jgi:SAM-dependent methyltransferase
MNAEPLPEGADAALALRGAVVAGIGEARYRLAATLAAQRRVLDAGCGLGVGIRRLHAAAPRTLIGVDRAPGKLDAAAPELPTGVELRVAELAALPFPDASFDLITCFGPLNGVAPSDAIVRELRRVLAAGGLLLVAVAPGAAPAVRAAFPVSRIVPERQAMAALAGDAEAPAGALPARLEPAPDPPEVLLAAGDQALPALPLAVALAGQLPVQQLLHHAERLRAQREALAGRLRTAERALAQRDLAAGALAACEAQLAAVPDLEARLLAAERRAELAEAECHRAAERLQELGMLDVELERSRATVEALTTSISWRATAPLRRIAGRARRGGGDGPD